jgi:hypothetical protein
LRKWYSTLRGPRDLDRAVGTIVVCLKARPRAWGRMSRAFSADARAMARNPAGWNARMLAPRVCGNVRRLPARSQRMTLTAIVAVNVRRALA